MKHKVLIIDDEEKLRKLLVRIISLEGYKVSEAGTLAAGEKAMACDDIDVIICDIKLPDGSGVAFTKEIKQKYPLTEVILLTAYGNIPDGVQAIKNGAFDYIIKGDDNDKIIPLLSKATEKADLQKKVTQLEKQLNTKFGFEAITGKSPAIICRSHTLCKCKK